MERVKYIQLYWFFKTLPPSAYIPNAANIKTKSATFAFSSRLLFFYFFYIFSAFFFLRYWPRFSSLSGT